MSHHLHFLAWDKVKKEWLWPYPEPFHIIGEVTVFDMLKQFSGGIERYNDIEVVQGTGLKDKNKKEIYEGHIIKNIEKKLKKIIYFGHSFEMRNLNDSYDKPKNKEYITIWWFNVEIIGNIFEHPELLK